MNIDLGVAPFAARWTLLDGHRIEQWLHGQPWISSDAPFVVRSPPGDRERFQVMEVLQSSLRAVGDRVRWSPVEDQDARDPVDILSSWLQVSANTDRELAEVLGRSVNIHSRLFVISIVGSARAALWQQKCLRLGELSQKLTGSSLCFLLLVSALDGLEDLPRLDVAWPNPVRRSFTDADLWTSYLHERVGWHTAGAIDDAQDVLLTQPIGHGDDRGLERALDAHAEQRFTALAASIARRLENGLDALKACPALIMPPHLPGAGRGVRPVPWLARALVRRQAAHPHRRFLRASVTCRPMAMRLLGRCIDMEARVKDLVIDDLSNAGPPPENIRGETTDALQRMQPGTGTIESELFPPGHPMPDSAWELASLGTLEFLAQCPNVTRKIRWVRNALAHGMPVGWKAHSLVASLERELDNAF